MSRPRTGNLRERRRADGTVLYTARVMAYGNREHVVLGDERDGMTRLMAKRALRELVRDIELGVWVPPAEADGSRAEASEPAEPTFAEAAAKFIEAKRLKGLEDSSMEALHWALDVHLVPFFGHLPPSQIDEQGVADYVAEEVARRDQIEALRERGQKLVGPRGGAMRGMSNQSINSSLRVLHNVLAWAAKQGWGSLADNPAAGIRLKERKRPTFPLEVDELADLIAAAGTPRPARRQDASVVARAVLIVRLRDEERRPWKVVAERAGVSETTAIYHYQQAKERTRFACDDERAAADEMFVMALAWTGARVSELCGLNVENVDLGHAKLRIPDSKTGAGVRSVDTGTGRHAPPGGRRHDPVVGARRRATSGRPRDEPSRVYIGEAALGLSAVGASTDAASHSPNPERAGGVNGDVRRSPSGNSQRRRTPVKSEWTDMR